jgi:hypothetical protein
MENTGSLLYISGGALVPQVPRLRYQFTADLLQRLDELAKNFDRLRHVTAGLELLPYCLGAASLAMFDLARNQITIVAAKAASENPGTTSELAEAQRNLLAYRLDCFLDAARRSQNAIIPYLRRAGPQLNLPKSLADIVKSLTNGTLALPEPFRSDTLDYWKKYGATLKSYRDLGQHYIIVGSSPKVVVPRSGKPALHFCLPNNPNARPINKLQYDNPQVHVQQFVIDQFASLLAYCYTVLEHLVDPEIDAALMPAMEGGSPMTRVGSGLGPQAYIPIGMEELQNSLGEFMKKLQSQGSNDRLSTDRERGASDDAAPDDKTAMA